MQKIQQIFVIVLNGLPDAEYRQLKETEGLQAWREFFTSSDVCQEFRFHTQTRLSLVEQFSKIAAKNKSVDTTRLDRSLLKNKAEQFSQQQTPTKKWRKASTDQFSRVNLVLNLKQLLTGNYPCPTHNPFAHFRALKSCYRSVSSSSPILALDVETVRSTKGVFSRSPFDCSSSKTRSAIDKFPTGSPWSTNSSTAFIKR